MKSSNPADSDSGQQQDNTKVGKSTPTNPSRRRVLTGMALTSAALWLPGCGGGDGDSQITSGTFHIPKTDFMADVRPNGRIHIRQGNNLITTLGADTEGARCGLTWCRAVHTTDNIAAGKALAQGKYGKDGLYLKHEFFDTKTSDHHHAARTFNVSRTTEGILALLISNHNGMAAIEIKGVDKGILKVSLTAPDGFNQITQTLPCSRNERFYGMGGQTWSSQHRGASIPMWVSEQGIGKVAGKDQLDPLQLKGLPYYAYTPIPWYLSSAGYGLPMDTYRRSTFDFATEKHPQQVRIRTWGRSTAFYLFTGDTPKDLVTAYTSISGRHTQMPPDWFFAPHNDAIHGSANVRRVARKLRSLHIPSSVIWTEDWAGSARNGTGFRLAQSWVVGNALYPDFSQLADDLHDTGYRFLGYFGPWVPNPQTTPGFNQDRYRTAVQNQYLFEKPDGKPYPMLVPPLALPPGYSPDWTNPEAVHWYQSYVRRAEQAGLDGAMVDYGEWVPFAAQFHNGKTAQTEHNRYPLRWQRANREIWDQLRPDGDYLFYVRSGYTGMQKNVPAVWAGDQNTNWNRVDGLPSVITMAINLGLCGVSFFGSDIGGYSAYDFPEIWDGVTTKDLFLRWTALGAFSPMMRTHHGNKYGQNWSWEGKPNPDNPKEPIPDPDTVRIYKHWATEHIRLFPYMQAFARVSLDTGLPIMRHMILENPDDRVVQGALPPAFDHFSGQARGETPIGELFQYYLGDSLLVAPIIDPGSRKRPVYLPAGEWYRIETGKRMSGPTTITARAAHDEMPVFARAGAIIPRLPEGVETLVRIDDPDIPDQYDMANRMDIDVYFDGVGDLTLEDGTSLEFRGGGAPAESATARLDGRNLTTSDDGETLAFETPSIEQGTITLTNGAGRAATLILSGAPHGRTYTIRAHY